MNESRIRQIRKDLDVPFDKWADSRENGGGMSKVFTLEVYLREILDEGLDGCGRCLRLEQNIEDAKRALSNPRRGAGNGN